MAEPQRTPCRFRVVLGTVNYHIEELTTTHPSHGQIVWHTDICFANQGPDGLLLLVRGKGVWPLFQRSGNQVTLVQQEGESARRARYLAARAPLWNGGFRIMANDNIFLQEGDGFITVELDQVCTVADPDRSLGNPWPVVLIEQAERASS